MAEQIWPTKQTDGGVFERHVYSGPQGEGYIDIFYKQTPDGKTQRKQVNHGPEERVSDQDFVELESNEDRDIKLKRISADEAVWTQDDGFKIKPESAEKYDENGKEKPIKEKKVKPDADTETPV